jgi:ankyrin repeat protein
MCVNAQMGNTALHEAVMLENAALCQLLMDHGADALLPNKVGMYV